MKNALLDRDSVDRDIEMRNAPEDTRSVDELIQIFDKGKRLKCLFFWGHRPKRKNVVYESCLSDWYPARFQIDSIGYPTTEHYMMAQNAHLFGDHESFERVVSAKSPREAKRLGRRVRGFDEETWSSARSKFSF